MSASFFVFTACVASRRALPAAFFERGFASAAPAVAAAASASAAASSAAAASSRVAIADAAAPPMSAGDGSTPRCACSREERAR